MVEDGASVIKTTMLQFLGDSKVTGYLLKGWILPIGGASEGKGLRLQLAQQAGFYLISKD